MLRKILRLVESKELSELRKENEILKVEFGLLENDFLTVKDYLIRSLQIQAELVRKLNEYESMLGHSEKTEEKNNVN